MTEDNAALLMRAEAAEALLADARAELEDLRAKNAILEEENKALLGDKPKRDKKQEYWEVCGGDGRFEDRPKRDKKLADFAEKAKADYRRMDWAEEYPRQPDRYGKVRPLEINKIAATPPKPEFSVAVSNHNYAGPPGRSWDVRVFLGNRAVNFTLYDNTVRRAISDMDPSSVERILGCLRGALRHFNAEHLTHQVAVDLFLALAEKAER